MKSVIAIVALLASVSAHAYCNPVGDPDAYWACAEVEQQQIQRQQYQQQMLDLQQQQVDLLQDIQDQQYYQAQGY